MSKLKEQLLFITDYLNTIPEDIRNEVQLRFLVEISADTLEISKIKVLLESEKLIENMELSEEDKKRLVKLQQTDLETFVDKDEMAADASADEAIANEEVIANKAILYYITKYEDQSIEIYLRKPKGYTVPVEIFEFISDVEDVQAIIKETCKTPKEIERYLTPLFGIAEVGGTSTYNSFAKKRLESFTNSFVRTKWWSLKLPFVKELGIKCLIMVIFYLIIIFALKSDFLSSYVYDKLTIDSGFLMNWFFVLMGTALGTWVSFSLFKKNKTLEEIKSLKDNIPDPVYRLALVSLVASIFYLLFITEVFNLEIGGGEVLNTKNIGNLDHGNLALLIGIFLGFGENKIGELLRTRIETFTSKL